MTSARSSVWTVSVHRSARKALRKLPRPLAAKLLATAESLERNPFPPGVEPIHGSVDTYRIWFGAYRIVYSLDHDGHRILVTRIAHRKDVYRNL